jgi:hypothetical protein
MVWLGCAHAAGLYPNRTAAADFLTYGANTIKGIGTHGFRTIKTYLTSNYASIYPGQNFGSVPVNLTQLAQTAPMVALFSDASFDRHVVTTYTFANGTASPVTAITPTQLTNEYTEVYNLCVYLLSTYSNKQFILQNTEGDWELLRGTDPSIFVSPEYCRNYASFCRIRQRAVRDARNATPSTSTISLAIECNRVHDDNHDNIVSTVLQLIQPDIINYTTYESTTLGLLPNQTQTEALIASRLKTIVTRIKRVCPDSRVIFSEFAWAQDEPSFLSLGLDVGGLIQCVIDSAAANGVDGCIWWQVFDNEEQSPGVPRGFGLYDRNGSSTSPGPLNNAGNKFVTLNS